MRPEAVMLPVIRAAADDLRELEESRPTSREECKGGMRPCPFVACRYNLYLDVKRTGPNRGEIQVTFPGLEPWEMDESCALDIADRGGVTLEAAGRLLNLTRERIRQIEAHTYKRLASSSHELVKEYKRRGE